MSQLTFTPKINDKSYQLVPNTSEKVENRLLNKGIKRDEKLKRIQSAQRLPFKPNIYNKNRARCQSARKQESNIVSQHITQHASVPKDASELHPRPPRCDCEDAKQKIYFKDKKKIRDFSPVLSTKPNQSSKSVFL